MAEIRQGYLDDYSQNSTGVGIGTSSASDAKFEIVGGTTSQELNVTGIATFGSVSGFIEKHTTYTENININDKSTEIPIGVSCRTCDRLDCSQRAFPPLHKKFDVDINSRGVSVYVGDKNS